MGIVIVAILSSTVLTEGTFECRNIHFPDNLQDIVHYVGHPATKALLEALGAVQASQSLFSGLNVGESYIAVPLLHNPRAGGYTVDTAIESVSDLQAKLVTRIA